MSFTEDMLKPKREGDIPYIYAKRNLPMEHTYPLFDKSWECFIRTMRDGKVVLEPGFKDPVRIEAITGECKIPDTPNNRKRFETLCKTRWIKGTEIELQADGSKVEKPTDVEVPPAFTRIDENLIEKDVLDSMEARLLERLLDKGIDLDVLREKVQKAREPEAPPEPKTPQRETNIVMRGNAEMEKIKENVGIPDLADLTDLEEGEEEEADDPLLKPIKK